VDIEIKTEASYGNVLEKERGIPISVNVAGTKTVELKFLTSGRRRNGIERREKID
jgi:hypothetical protein